MKVVKLITWSQEDRSYLNKLDRWMSLCGRLELDEKGLKAAARLARGSGERMSENNLVESYGVWGKICRVMREQKANAAELESRAPDIADGLLARPKQMMILLQDISLDAIRDINEAMELVVRALELVRG